MLTAEGQSSYNLGREAAGRLLKVSTRTLDRYVRSKKLSTRVVAGRIWLNKEEVEAFLLKKMGTIETGSVYMSRDKMSIDNMSSHVDSVEVVDHISDDIDRFENISSSKKEKARSSSETYRSLYLELQEELKEKQDRIELANYRVGQLETQLKNTIPMLEYHREKYEKNTQTEELKNQLSESSNLLSRLTLNLKYERFSKRVFLIIILIILALQPLWLLIFRNPFE